MMNWDTHPLLFTKIKGVEGWVYNLLILVLKLNTKYLYYVIVSVLGQ